MHEMINGVPPNVDPPPIHEVVLFYEQVWSVRVQDDQSVKPKLTSIGDNHPLRKTNLTSITPFEIHITLGFNPRFSHLFSDIKGLDNVVIPRINKRKRLIDFR